MNSNSASCQHLTRPRPPNPCDTTNGLSGRRFRGKPSYPIPVWSGLLEHRRKIGAAVWVYLWCLDHITTERNSVGLVAGGKPVRIREIANDLDCSQKEVARHLHRLAGSKPIYKAQYIELVRCPYGFVIRVLRSNKFGIWKRRNPNLEHSALGPQEREDRNVRSLSEQLEQKCATDRTLLTERSDKSVRNKEDTALHTALDTAPLGKALPRATGSGDGANYFPRLMKQIRELARSKSFGKDFRPDLDGDPESI